MAIISEGEHVGRDKHWCSSPIMNLSIGGRYCSITTVERGKAFVLERTMARTATAKIKKESGSTSKMLGSGSPPSIPDDPRVFRSAHSQSLCTIYVGSQTMKQTVSSYLFTKGISPF